MTLAKRLAIIERRAGRFNSAPMVVVVEIISTDLVGSPGVVVIGATRGQPAITLSRADGETAEAFMLRARNTILAAHGKLPADCSWSDDSGGFRPAQW